MMLETGTVKWFKPAKGFGFITRASGEDIFVHNSATELLGYRPLVDGETVRFMVVKGKKGLQAEGVCPA